MEMLLAFVCSAILSVSLECGITERRKERAAIRKKLYLHRMKLHDEETKETKVWSDLVFLINVHVLVMGANNKLITGCEV